MLTFSVQNVIMYTGDCMDFFNYDFNIEQIVFACLVPAGTGDTVHKNRPSHGLALNLGGEKNYIFDNNTTLSVKNNDIIFLPEKSDYIVEDCIPGDCYAINFKLHEDITFPPFVRHAKNSSGFLDLFMSAEKTFKAKKHAYMLKCKADLYSIIHLLVHEYDMGYLPSKKEITIAPAVKYIHEHYSENEINIDFLSHLCGIKESYFRRIFTNCYGLSPINYINRLKLSRAKEILLQTTYKIDTVAQMSGFNDIYWFCRFFKKETGLTPSEYRKKI